MPDKYGNMKIDEAPHTSLHAYADHHEGDIEPGTLGVTGNEPDISYRESSYKEGGFHDHTQFGATPPATGRQDAAGAHTGTGVGTNAEDPRGHVGDGGRTTDHDLADPADTERADASRAPRGTPPR